MADAEDIGRLKPRPAGCVSNRLSLGTGLFVAAWGLLVIVGWQVENLGLTQLYSAWAPMDYDTALGLFLCGAGLAGASLGSWRIAFFCSVLAAALSALAVVENLFRLDLRVTEWLVPVAWQSAEFTGRMSLNAAGGLFLSSLMLAAIGNGILQKVEGYAFASMLGLLVALFGVLSLITFFSAMNIEAGETQLTLMAPQAALGFSLLGFSAAIFRWPEDAQENVNIRRLQNMVIAYVSGGVLVAMLFSVAIGLLPIYELILTDPLYEATKTIRTGADGGMTVTSHEHLSSALKRQVALTSIATLLLAYIGGFGVWRLLRPLTGRILMRADALEKTIQKATEDLASSISKLEHSNRRLDEFAKIVSHDLQAPLRGITGFAELLENKYGKTLDADAREFIGHIAGGARQMQAQINGLLQLSRLSSRAQPMTPVDTGAVLAQLREQLQMDLEQANAALHYSGLPTVYGDQAQIALLFQNLIMNAIKFHRPDARPEVTVSAQRADGHWRFRVSDNGIGIDPAHHAAIFEIFRRLHTQSEYPGTGIGLALCKDIVQRHGGEIAVESQPGAGSTFVFTLPAAAATQGT